MPRPHNSKDKNRVFLNNRLKEMFGDDFEPIIQMSKAAMQMQELCDRKIEISKGADGEVMEDEITPCLNMLAETVKAWEKPAKFLTPQLKAVEHDLGDGLKDDLNDLLDDIEKSKSS